MTAVALYNLARMTTATTGTGTITLGSNVSGFLTFASAGVQDGDLVAYGIRDGSNSEAGYGTYASSGTTLTRTVVTSTNSNSPITLSGSAEVYVTALAADLVAAFARPPQCGKLSYVSTSQIKFAPYNGDQIKIGGYMYYIPSSGITLSNSGLTASTLYYIYAYNNSGTLTLEASTTGHSTSTTAGNVGVEIKTGDNTRTLVGMAYSDSGSLFQSSATQRFVLSWFNQQKMYVRGSLTANRTLTSAPWSEVNSEARVEFLTWGVVTGSLVCAASLSVSGTTMVAGVGVDSTSASTVIYGIETSTTSGYQMSFNSSADLSLSEGYHYGALLGGTNGGTATFLGDPANTGGFQSLISFSVYG